jgi:4-amino-4-deoxy-L-arabinose transferase-like glycosyltransferase
LRFVYKGYSLIFYVKTSTNSDLAKPCAPTCPPNQRSLMLLWWVLCLAYLVSLGVAPLFDVDEGAFAEASREMLSSRDWGHTTLNGADRFDKPILIYWLQAASMALFGLNEWAVRLPSALCALTTAWVVGQYAARAWGSQARWPATFLLATSLGFVVIGRAATADALLNLLLALTGLRLWRFAIDGHATDLRWACWWAGWGLLTKGPVAVLVPGAALLLWSLSTGHGQRLRQALVDWRGWLILLGVSLPWYSYALWRHGQAFIDGFFLRHNLARFSGPLEGHGGSLLYYLLVLPLLWLPWPLLLALVARRAKPFWQDHSQRFLLIWAGFVVTFFSLSGTKLPHYALYGSVALALLMAWRVSQGEVRQTWLRLLAASTALLVLLMAALPFAAVHWGKRLPDAWLAGLFDSAPSAMPVVWSGLGAVALMVALIVARRTDAVARLWVAAVMGVAHFTLFVVPWWGDTLQGPVREAGIWAKAQGNKTVQWQLHQPSFAFYSGQATALRAPLAGELALVRLDRQPDGVALKPQFVSRGLAVVSLPTVPVSPAGATQ